MTIRLEKVETNSVQSACEKVYFAGLQIRDNLGDPRTSALVDTNNLRVSAAQYLSKNNL